MPNIRLTFHQAWYERIKRAAEKSGQSPGQLLQGIVALSIPPPPRCGVGAALPRHEELIAQVVNLCHDLDETRNQLVGALNRVAKEPRRRPQVMARRKIHAASLKAAIKKKGVTQKTVAAYLGVARQNVSAVIQQRVSLPDAWLDSLDEFFGEGWLMSE